MKYYARYLDGFKEVEGEPIIIKGFEDFDFFIHPAINRFGYYSISEVNTGLCVPLYYKSKKTILEQTIAKLNKYGLDNFRAILIKNLSEPNNQSPLYKKTNLMDRTVIIPQDIHIALKLRTSKNHENYSEYLFKILRHELLRKHSKK